MENETHHPLRVTNGVGDRNGAALQHSEQAKSVQPRRIDDHLDRRDIFKQNRAAAFAEWRQLAA